ncbi:hypothetical protein MTsPCn9_34910 [Croceitalea sp. MTPC9]|uniref:hypothetical protein n=1 Tax=unclassified Croceitalea TaxID=2632280 RepID=UPI002B385FE3|nr:hypothetical protein MTsPCn6_35240 [Croceitalea sp. MTPC6]GMN18551.1 hypothetical protein MTsPCn9_34910 [Croceitalea sp. MTPC9]|tara:strand:+ start:465 stop:782 length:318 start_codon:yes stop_codon:yes gene_type:complete
MKTNQKLSKTALLTAVLGLSTTAMQAQDFRGTINQAINDYLIPVVLLILLIGAIIGLTRNWEEVNNRNTRKEGLINAGIILLYAALFAGVIAAVVIIGGRISVNI